MEAVTTALAVLLAVHLCAAEEAPFSVTIGPCPNTPQVDWTESISAFLWRIPNNITLPGFLESNEVLGVEVGSPRLTGLGELWTYKQHSRACFSGTTTFVEAVAFARVPLAVTMSWKGCTGGSGHMGIEVSSSQLRLVFKAAPTNDDPAHLELARIYPVSLEDGEVFVSGAPKLVTRLAHYASMFLKHQIEHLWSYILRMEPQILLRDMRPHA